MAQRPEYHIKTGLTATVKEHCTVRVTDMVSCNEKNEHTPKKIFLCILFPSSMLDTISEWLWWERLWLPVNVSWSDLEDNEGRVYAKASQLYGVLPCALCMLLVRYLFERYDYSLLVSGYWDYREYLDMCTSPLPDI